MLPRWGGGGSFHFDLDEYIAQRAAAEGVEVGSEVRRFGDHASGEGAAAGSAASEDAMNASLSMSLLEVMSTVTEESGEGKGGGGEEGDAAEGVAHAAALMKRGGGGAFGNLKWKKKCAHALGCHCVWICPVAVVQGLATSELSWHLWRCCIRYGVLLGSGSALLYFDSDEVTESNMASRVVPLQDSSLEAQPKEDVGHEQ
eukprot:COSAG06_NODE_12047_length_1430_cov_1.244929_1_plen_201_part_00